VLVGDLAGALGEEGGRRDVRGQVLEVAGRVCGLGADLGRLDLRVLGAGQLDGLDAAVVLRVPVSGNVKGTDTPWPRVGQQLKQGTTIGTVQPRLVPSDQIALTSERTNLQTQIGSAKAESSGKVLASRASRRQRSMVLKRPAETSQE